MSLGSNIDPEQNLPEAVRRLRLVGALLAVSNVYQNPAIGGIPQADYLNAVALLRVDVPAESIRAQLREIEADLGRIRTEDKYAPRTIDLDLILLGQLTELDPALPDPELASHAHLAIPAAEVAPDYRHPSSGHSLRSLAERLDRPANFQPRDDVAQRLLEIVEQAETPS